MSISSLSSSSDSDSSSDSSLFLNSIFDDFSIRRRINQMIQKLMIDQIRRKIEPSYKHKRHKIYKRKKITSKYIILNLIASTKFSDVFRALRISDALSVTLKLVHDHDTAFREIEILKLFKGCENVVVFYEFFGGNDGEEVVLVLEYFVSDLETVIYDGKKSGRGVSVGEGKRWMVQILEGVKECHKRGVVHRDLKPGNLLVSGFGVLKLGDFGQARILVKTGVSSSMHNVGHNQQNYLSEDQCNIWREQLFRNLFGQGANYPPIYNMELYEGVGDNDGPLTSFLGTRWFRAPELLYGSSNYGIETDLWSLGCIFAELLSLEPIFPGTSEMDQLARIFNVLGNLTEENYPGCSNLPIYDMILFNKREKPIGIEGCLPGRSPGEILIVKKLLCFDPTKRVTAMELLQDKYFKEEPLPVPMSALIVPKTRCVSSSGDESGDEETSSGDESDDEESSSGDESDNEETSSGDGSDDEETSSGDGNDDEETSSRDGNDDEETSSRDGNDGEETGSSDRNYNQGYSSGDGNGNNDEEAGLGDGHES